MRKILIGLAAALLAGCATGYGYSEYGGSYGRGYGDYYHGSAVPYGHSGYYDPYYGGHGYGSHGYYRGSGYYGGLYGAWGSPWYGGYPGWYGRPGYQHRPPYRPHPGGRDRPDVRPPVSGGPGSSNPRMPSSMEEFERIRDARLASPRRGIPTAPARSVGEAAPPRSRLRSPDELRRAMPPLQRSAPVRQQPAPQSRSRVRDGGAMRIPAGSDAPLGPAPSPRMRSMPAPRAEAAPPMRSIPAPRAQSAPPMRQAPRQAAPPRASAPTRPAPQRLRRVMTEEER